MDFEKRVRQLCAWVKTKRKYFDLTNLFSGEHLDDNYGSVSKSGRPHSNHRNIQNHAHQHKYHPCCPPSWGLRTHTPAHRRQEAEGMKEGMGGAPGEWWWGLLLIPNGRSLLSVHLNTECMACDESVIAGGQVVYLLSPLRHHRSTLTFQLLVRGQARPSTLLQTTSEGKRTDE